MRLFKFTLLVFLLLHPARSQTAAPNPVQTLPVIQTEFQKQNASWNWLFRVQLDGRIKDDWSWDVREIYTSNLQTPTFSKKLWKDEHNFQGSFLRNSNFHSYGLYARSWLQSDEQTGSDNLFENNVLGIKASYRIPEMITVVPYVGYQQYRYRTRLEWGWDTGIRGELYNFQMGDYNTNIIAESNFDFYENLQNQDHFITANIGVRFNPYTYDSLFISYHDINQENYAPNLTDIIHVKRTHRQFNNKLFYLISPTNRFVLLTSLRSRDLSDYTNRNTFYIENQFRFMHIGTNLNYGFSLRSNEETLDNSDLITNSETKETALGFNLGYQFNADNLLDMDFSYVKMQYDTPHEKNNDDRDEQRFIFRTNYFHRFSPYLSMNWLAYVYLYHQIYIFSEQSANNSWNRVYKLHPSLNYRYGRLSNSLSTQVLANYTAYDFENPDEVPRSIVSRKYSFSDSLTYRFFAANYIGFFTRLELDDKGTFYQKEFAQRIVQSYQSQFYTFYLMNRHFLKFRIRAGYTYYLRNEWRHIPVKKSSREFINQGPFLSIMYVGSRRLFLIANIAYSRLSDSRTITSTFFTGYLRMNFQI